VTQTLAEANSIVDIAIAKARQFHITVSVAVCDNLGHLIALNRMDGVYGEANRFSIGKAVTGLPSAEVEGIVDHPPTAYQSESEADCRFSEMAKSRARVESAECHPTNKRRSVLALELPASSSKKAG
jgi:uncharacterized protein GlcG (DUF336 family)